MTFKDLKKEYIVEAATKLFLNNGISLTTYKDISSVSNVGEATLYRYFSHKENLAEAVAIKLQKDIFSSFNLEHKESNGLKMIEEFYAIFKHVFSYHLEYFRFIAEFDTLYLSSINSESYSDTLDTFKELYMSFYKKGLIDKSIKEYSNIELFYFTSTHALLELCKKLASEKSSLKQDLDIKKVDEVNTLINIFISVLKA